MTAPAVDRHAAFVDALVAWLNRRFARDGVVIGPDTPLFATRLIDSLRILELIAFTEHRLGLRIPDNAVRMDNFATPARIAAVFAPTTEADAPGASDAHA
jgi:acyl carrier protein